VISALTHIARLARAGFVFAREGVFGVVDPSLVPPPGSWRFVLPAWSSVPAPNPVRGCRAR
jgi:hypothetical protein